MLEVKARNQCGLLGVQASAKISTSDVIGKIYLKFTGQMILLQVIKEGFHK